VPDAAPDLNLIAGFQFFLRLSNYTIDLDRSGIAKLPCNRSTQNDPTRLKK